jgi:biotin carboxyl carrier protein
MRYTCRDEAVTLPHLDGWSVQLLPGGTVELSDGNRTIRVPFHRAPSGEIEISWEGRRFVFAPERAARRKSERKPGSLSSPMAGVVADILVQVGDSVIAYQPVAVVEAMKVLATLEAPVAGNVTAVHFTKGDRVEHGAVLVEIE